jgi:phage terminase large subunit-like protein
VGWKAVYSPNTSLGWWRHGSYLSRYLFKIKLLGAIGDFGSGMIPKELIVETKTRRNVPDAIETIRVKHITGGVSTLVLKTYDQGREAWQGAEVSFIWIDEECPQEIYGEALIRLMTTGGSAILTFTPLSGLTELVSNFLDNSQETDVMYPKHITTVSWDDVPHLSIQMKEEMLAATPPALRDARSKGEPTVGSGRIYPVDVRTVIVEDFKLPKHWQRSYALDVGWNNCVAKDSMVLMADGSQKPFKT